MNLRPEAKLEGTRFGHTIVEMLPSYDAGNMIPILTTVEPEAIGEGIPQLSELIPEDVR